MVYVPGTEERDLKKVIMSLQQVAATTSVPGPQGPAGPIGPAGPTGPAGSSLNRMKVINITDAPYNCVADSSTDNSSGLQAAINAAQSSGLPLYIQGATVSGGASGTYRYGTTLTFNGAVPMIGDFVENSILEYTGTGNAMNINPATPTYAATAEYPMRGRMENFTIRPATVGGGTYGINVVLTWFYPSWNWTNIRSGQFGSYSVVFDNSAALTDGFFTGIMTNVQLGNGFSGTKVGDSLEFLMCHIGGNLPIAINGTPGARQLVFRNCSIVNRGGIIISDVAAPRFLECHIEVSGTWLGGSTALLSINNAYTGSILRCRVASIGSGAKPTYAIQLVGNSTAIVIDECEPAIGSSGHIYTGPSTSRIRIRDGMIYDTSKTNSLNGASTVDSSY